MIAASIFDYEFDIGLAGKRGDAGVKATVQVLRMISECEREISRLSALIAELEEGSMCGGTIENRGNGSSLAVHPTNCKCPFPGHAGATSYGKGVRRYIRQGYLGEVLLAQENYLKWQDLTNKLRVNEAYCQKILVQLQAVAKTAA